VLDRGLDVVSERVWDAVSEIFDFALAPGGTLSGEHGIGLLKGRWLEAELGARQLELQRGIKNLFDPAGIMNPGTVFPVNTFSREHRFP
jgi:glycolate oxidase